MIKRYNDKKPSKGQTKKEAKENIVGLLARAGIRPTRQRIDISGFLFDGKSRHVTAEEVLARAKKERINVSLATIYNSLNNFTKAGLLKEVVIGQNKTVFDTNVDHHHHFFDEENNHLWDIPAHEVSVEHDSAPPGGLDVDRIEVTVYVRRPD